MTTTQLRSIAPGVHVCEARQRFLGLSVGARMTVLELNGGLMVHSPIAVDPNTVGSIGRPGWVLAPNLLHHLYVGPWIDAGFEGWACPGLSSKRPDLRFAGEVSSDGHPFGDELRVLPLASFPLTNEVVVLHRPSRTLIVCDLVFNFSSTAPWFTRTVMRCLGGYPGCRTTLVEQWGMRRAVARQELNTILEWDFDRIIVAHGCIVESNAKQALRAAFRWLLAGPQ